MAFTIPNEADAAFADQAEIDSVDLDILVASHDQTGVLDGCAVTAQGTPDMTVAVAAGNVLVAGTEVAVTGGNVTITAANATNPRFDLIVVNSSGTKSAVAGTPSSNPVFPAIPASSAVLASVYVPANDTDIDSDQIVDKRVVVRPFEGGGTSWYTSDLAVVDQALSSNLLAFTTVTAHATPHTEGAWTQIIASTSGNATMLVVFVTATASTAAATDVLLDIGTGAAASETAVVNNLTAGFQNTMSSGATGYGATYYIPIAVASGTRISARAQALVGGDTVSVHITTMNGTNRTASAIDTVGAVTASSRGTNVAAGTSGAEGSWVEIEDSTVNAYAGLLYGIGGGGSNNLPGGNGLLDIGTGAAAAETAIMSNIGFRPSNNETMALNLPIMPFDATIPAGTRISARISQNAAAAANYDVIVYGLRA